MADGKHRVGEHRRRMREQGFRPIQVWVPDTRGGGFRDEAHRRPVAAAEDAHTDDQDFIETVSAPWDEE